MKNWILNHKKCYYFIIGVIAFISFLIITLCGVTRIANAETVDDAWFYVDDVAIPDITTLDFSSFAEYFEEEYGYTGNIGEKILKEHKYCVVVINPYYWPYSSDYESNASAYFSFLFTNEPVIYETNEHHWLLANWNTSVSFDFREGKVKWMRGYGMSQWDGTSFGYGTDLIPFPVNSNNSSTQVIASTYDLGDELYLHPSYTSFAYPKTNAFSMDAPYFRFDSLYIRNRVYNGEVGLGLEMDEIYSELTANSVWTYNGILENLDAYPGAEYYIDLNFTLQLPTIEWLQQKYTDTTTSATTYVKWTIDIIDEWYLDSSIPKYSYNISMPIPIEPTSDGHFSFSFTFNEFLTYIRYFYPDAKEIINSLPLSSQGAFISYVCVESLRGSVVTKTDNQNIYGRFTHNEFVRGDMKTCLEVIPDENYYDMTEDEFDQYFDDIYKEAHDDYLVQLQDRIDDLQNQIDSMQSIDGAFSNLGASDLWSGFVGAVKGISQLGASVGALSLAIGSVFAFLPMQIGAYMGFTLLAILVIAIIKAIRG